MVLNIEATIQKLRQYHNVTFTVFSVYLQIPPDEKDRGKKLREQFQHLINKQLHESDIVLYQQDLNYISAYLDDYKHTNHYKGIALFSGGNKLWEVITIYNQLPDKLTVSHSPDLKPLMKTISNYRRFLVVLADRQKAKFFILHMGQIEAQGGVEDPSVPQKVKGRNMADIEGKVDRHIRLHLQKHLQFIGSKVGEFVRNKQISGVILGGHKEIMHNLKENLPHHLQQKVVGEFISELNTSMNTILNESKTVIDKVNHKLNQAQQFHPG